MPTLKWEKHFEGYGGEMADFCNARLTVATLWNGPMRSDGFSAGIWQGDCNEFDPDDALWFRDDFKTHAEAKREATKRAKAVIAALEWKD